MQRGFDEVMIVNPYDPASGVGPTVRLTGAAFAETDGLGGYGEPMHMGYISEFPDLGGYHGVGWYGAVEPVGYYAEDPLGASTQGPLGWYGEDPYAGGVGEDVLGWYGEDPYGGYAEDPYGGYAEDLYGDYAEDLYGDYAEDLYGDYAEDAYGEDPFGEAVVGEAPFGEDPYGEDPFGEDPYGEDPFGEEPFGEEPLGEPGEVMAGVDEVPEMPGYAEEPFGEPDLGGYVRAGRPAFNAGCPLPTNVDGMDEAALEGYVRPRRVSPRVRSFSPQDAAPGMVPDTLRPLW